MERALRLLARLLNRPLITMPMWPITETAVLPATMPSTVSDRRNAF